MSAFRVYGRSTRQQTNTQAPVSPKTGYLSRVPAFAVWGLVFPAHNAHDRFVVGEGLQQSQDAPASTMRPSTRDPGCVAMESGYWCRSMISARKDLKIDSDRDLEKRLCTCCTRATPRVQCSRQDTDINRPTRTFRKHRFDPGHELQ